MKKLFLGLICLSILVLAGCSQESSTPIPPIVNEPEPPKDIRAMSVKWEEDRLFYFTDQGVYAYFPTNGETITLKSEDVSKQYNSANFWLSPDRSKYILINFHSFGSTLEIRDATGDASIMVLDTRKYTEGVGEFSPPVYDAGWVDNNHIYLSTGFRLFIVDIDSGEEVQVTEECSPVTTKVSGDMVAPYLDWARNVMKIGDKLYYNSTREANDLSYHSIYVGDQTGERELIENAYLLLAVDDRSFVYTKTSSANSSETFLYNIETGSSSLIIDKIISEELYILSDGKLSFMTGTISEGNYQGGIFDPVTLELETYTVYDPDLPDRNIQGSQFRDFHGAYKQDAGYMFLYSVDKSAYNTTYYLYSTTSNEISEISEIGGYGSLWINLKIDPSGEYVAVTKYKSGDDDFLFDIIKTDDLLGEKVRRQQIPENTFEEG